MLERRYICWGDPDKPVWDDNGFILPSAHMTGNGVTREWTLMLRPWLRPADVDAEGKLSIARRAADPWQAVLDAVPALDRDCQIELVTRKFRRKSEYRCASCGENLVDQPTAVRHQLGEKPVTLLTLIHKLDGPPLDDLAQAAAARKPTRWQWLRDDLRLQAQR